MTIQQIVVASQNPVKQRAALRGFERIFPQHSFEVQPVAVPSGVSIQPASDEETLQGALNRVQTAIERYPSARYWVGIEGGVDMSAAGMTAFAWIVVSDGRLTGKSRTGAFYLPPRIVELVEAGHELGHADDIVFGETNSKQQAGAIGLLTGGVVDRQALYEQAVILALLPFRNRDLYSTDSA